MSLNFVVHPTLILYAKDWSQLVFSGLTSTICSIHDITIIIDEKSIDQGVICPGNDEEELIAICQQRGGTRGMGTKIAYIDNEYLSYCPKSRLLTSPL